VILSLWGFGFGEERKILDSERVEGKYVRIPSASGGQFEFCSQHYSILLCPYKII